MQNAPRITFGVHGCTPYSRTTGLPLGELRVLKGSSVSLAGELVEQTGGSNKYPWAVEEGVITSELTLNVGEMPNFLFELFLGTAPTDLAAQTSGSISTAANKNGSTIIHATNGISSTSLLSGSAANLKFGKYVIEGSTATTFNVYHLSGVDIGRGTDGEFLTDGMKIAGGLSFTASVASIPAYGLQFNQVGTPNFTVGDTATFEVLPVSSGSTSVIIGGVNQSFPEFGALVYSQKRGNQEMLEIDLFRCKAAGMPIPFEMGAFNAHELKAKVLRDDSVPGIFKMRHVKPT